MHSTLFPDNRKPISLTRHIPVSDHAVVIWEEREGGFDSLATPERSADGFFEPADNGGGSGGGGDSSPTNHNGNGAEGGGGAVVVGGGATSSSSSSSSSSRWVSKATLSDARRAVTCVQFRASSPGIATRVR
jgi:hypothetical protein